MNYFQKMLTVALCFLSFLWFAQSVNISPTPAQCPGNGAVTVTTSGVTQPLFQLKDSSGNNIGSGSTSGTFTSLDAGNYQINVTGQGSFNETHPFQIANNYTPIPLLEITISDLCDSTFTIGGTLSISVTPVPGKTYTYKVVQSNDPSFPDTLGTYVSISTITNITAFGKYQIRVKDECGQTTTLTRDIQPALQRIANMSWNVANDQVCNQSAGMSAIQFYAANGSLLNLSTYAGSGGIKVEMWERPSNACPTNVPATAPIFSQIITSNTGYVLPINNTKRYVIRITTPCGEESISCYESVSGATPAFTVANTNSGCGASETMSIKGSSTTFLKYPVQVEIRNAANTVVYTYTANDDWQTNNWAAANLPMGNYTVRYTDACGYTDTRTVANPNIGSPTTPTVSVAYTKYRCFDDNSGSLTLTGATQIALTINGYIPNRENAVVTIISGPSNVGVPAKIHNNTLFVWTNVIPGPYTIRINSGCSGAPIDLNFNVSPPSSQILQQSLNSTGTSFCSGGGSISSTIIYTGVFNNVVELLNSSNTVIAENTSGTFANIAPGTYKTRLRISTCTSFKYYIENANSIVITNQSTGPQIVKKVGIVCENAQGVPLSAGTAYFEIAGAAPLTVQYKLQSEPDSALITFSNNAPSSFQITGLTPNQTYELVVTSCGNSIRTSIIIQTPGSMSVSNTVNPCVNSPYTLSAPDYAGATYEWTNPSGTMVATTKDYHIANYNASYDGQYNVKITWGGCVVRFTSIYINSQQCGGPIDAVCTKPGDFTIAGNPTKLGITVQEKKSGWPESIPNGFVTLESRQKGFVITRVANEAAISDPKAGMLIYDMSTPCVKLYNGNSWSCIKKSCNDTQ
jgi:hypothetical protein